VSTGSAGDRIDLIRRRIPHSKTDPEVGVEVVEMADEEHESSKSTALRIRQISKQAIDRGRAMGADVSEAELLFAMGNKRQQDGEWEQAIGYFSDSLDEAIKAGKAITWQGGDGKGQ
jgi:hypothetical protein